MPTLPLNRRLGIIGLVLIEDYISGNKQVFGDGVKTFVTFLRGGVTQEDAFCGTGIELGGRMVKMDKNSATKDT